MRWRMSWRFGGPSSENPGIKEERSVKAPCKGTVPFLKEFEVYVEKRKLLAMENLRKIKNQR